MVSSQAPLNPKKNYNYDYYYYYYNVIYIAAHISIGKLLRHFRMHLFLHFFIYPCICFYIIFPDTSPPAHVHIPSCKILGPRASC